MNGSDNTHTHTHNKGGDKNGSIHLLCCCYISLSSALCSSSRLNTTSLSLLALEHSAATARSSLAGWLWDRQAGRKSNNTGEIYKRGAVCVGELSASPSGNLRTQFQQSHRALLRSLDCQTPGNHCAPSTCPHSPPPHPVTCVAYVEVWISNDSIF